MTNLNETAHAKINLALHVRARRIDGYHDIETLFAFLDDGDRIAVEPADSLSLTITGRFAGGLSSDEDNLVLCAARAMQVHFGIAHGAQITLDKRLPVAAGLGGGSADAAAVARALNSLWGIDADDTNLIDAIGGLGADVPVCISSHASIGHGTGEKLEAYRDARLLSGRPTLLVNPLKACATTQVYAGWDGIDRGSLAILRSAWRNDLTASAVALVPEIGTILYLLAGMEGVVQSAMSGSGATCFALFEETERRDEAQAQIKAMQPGWWTMTGRLL